MSGDWDVVGLQGNKRISHSNEEQEAILRDKAMLIIANRGYTNYAWKRVITRLMKCLKLG
jgi:hypothetical protein